MYEFLKKLFGTVDGQPEALTYEQLEEKIKGDKNLKIVNLADGGYVAEVQSKRDGAYRSETAAHGCQYHNPVPQRQGSGCG